MRRILIFIQLLYCSAIFAQHNDINYVIDFITTKQGLSHNYASSIVSDDLNIKWIGTENGITKFNGYDFDYIKPSEAFPELLNENIEVLFVDKEYNLWIGTKSGGLSYLDIKNNQIQHFNYLIDLANEGDLRITSLSQDNQGNIWIGTWNDGVFIIDYKNNKLIKHLKVFQQVYSIEKDFNGIMWICQNKKISSYNDAYEIIKTFDLNEQVTDILSDPSRNKVWISTSGIDTKLYCFNYYTESIESIETNVSSNFSKKLSLDKYNRIWIGTWGKGVYRSNENLSSFKKVELISTNPDKKSGNYNIILDVHHDKNNVTWLATAHGGIVKLLEGNGFENADKLITNTNLKGFLNCTSIFRTDKNLFVGTINGLYHGTDFSNLTQLKSIGNTKINAFYKKGNKLYIGTADGFSIYDFATSKIIFNTDKLSKVTSFFIDNNTIYIGTQQQGLAVVELTNITRTDTYKLYSENLNYPNRLESNRVTGIKKDNNNNIWVSTYNGLHLWDYSTKTFKHQATLLNGKLPSVIINSFVLRDNFLWLATPNGLIKLNYINNRLEIEKTITQKDGLNSDFICSITFDQHANLWLSTHTEIVKYNDKNQSIISYGEINGVKSTSFNNNSFLNYNHTLIYFGGIDNVTFFNPSKIIDFHTKPDIIFTNLRVNNQLVQYQPGNNILDKNFNYANNIKLSYKDNFFSTGFITNDYLGKLNIKYRYALEGYQNEWMDLQNRNEINFAGLSPGKYRLLVQASRDSQTWSEPKSISINLLGSPWKSGLAISIYALILIGIITYLIKSNNYKLKLKNRLEIARIDKEKEIELTEAKLNFFTNISHEFRTPLTLIISPLKELLEREDLPVKAVKNLSYIDRNTNRLLNLINQLLDFRKADHGLLKLDVSHGNFVRFSNEVHLYFSEAAKTKKIRYKFKSAQEEIYFPFDRNKMEIVLCNLLSNAIKYTEPEGKITMKVKVDDDYCVISIKDTGVGMNATDLDKIFDRFFQIKSANTARIIGSGIGLSFSKKIIELHHGSISVKSEVNQGSEFIVKLAMNPKVYKGEINENFITTDNIKGYNTNHILKPVETLSINRKEHTVLIIDDNLEILGYLKEILSETYNVIEANNGDTGFENASNEIPDLIISDVMMPGKDGITLCKELKSQITTSHIPIILLTARTSTVFEIEGLKTGADDYITKPFNSKVIKARIASLLENRDKQRAHLLNKVRFEPTANQIESDLDTENAFIHKAILLVEKNLDNPNFGIENMVDNLNMSQSTLYRKIKSLTGLSLTAFIRSIRLKKAAHLILSSDLNLNQIAYDVGFNDYKYFKTSFKKQFNCLPSKYKEQMINH